MKNDLTNLDRDFLLAWFQQNLSAEHRGRLMQDLPLQYNRMVGRTIMGVENLTRREGYVCPEDREEAGYEKWCADHEAELGAEEDAK